jgi:hypothetical protein
MRTPPPLHFVFSIWGVPPGPGSRTLRQRHVSVIAAGSPPAGATLKSMEPQVHLCRVRSPLFQTMELSVPSIYNSQWGDTVHFPGLESERRAHSAGHHRLRMKTVQCRRTESPHTDSGFPSSVWGAPFLFSPLLELLASSPPCPFLCASMRNLQVRQVWDRTALPAPHDYLGVCIIACPRRAGACKQSIHPRETCARGATEGRRLRCGRRTSCMAGPAGSRRGEL